MDLDAREIMDLLRAALGEPVAVRELELLLQCLELPYFSLIAKRYIYNVPELLRAIVVNPPEEVVEDGILEEIGPLGRRMQQMVENSGPLELFLSITDPQLQRQLERVLEGLQHLRLSYVLLSDKRTIRNREADFQAALKIVVRRRPSFSWESLPEDIYDDLAILSAVYLDFRQVFMEQYKSLDRQLRPPYYLLHTADTSFERHKHFAQFIKTFHAEGFVPLFIYYQNAVKKIKPGELYFPRTAQLDFVDNLVENLKELIKGNVDSIGPLKPYILEVQETLEFLSSSLVQFPEPRKEEDYLKDRIRNVTDLAYEVECAIDLFQLGDTPIWLSTCWLHDILKKMKFEKRQVDMDFGDVESTVRYVKSIDTKELKIIPIVNEIEISEKLRKVFNDPAISNWFTIRTWSLISSYQERKKQVLHELLGNASYANIDDFKKLETGLIDKAYASYVREYELTKLLRKLLMGKRYFIILEDVGGIDALNDIISVLPDSSNGSRILLTTRSPELAVQCRKGFQKGFLPKKSGDNPSTSQTNMLTTDDDVVGFKTEIEKVRELLITGSENLNIISIFGMAGQGKTTLTKKLYDDLSVVNYFHRRAWYCVSQVYEKRQMLLELLGQVGDQPDTVHLKNDAELAEMLYKSLCGRRFLIVLDDMWSIGAWNDLARCIPNHKEGSRIIFTTRLQQVASQVQSGSILQPLGPLSDAESWELLKKKVFKEETYPPELQEIGIRIANNCKGLPLAIILVAGLLSKMEKKEDQWEHIAESLSSSILGDLDPQGKGVIELSYKHLPDHLKPCFLYFGTFLEDKDVPAWKLIQLWIAEGFIKQTEKSLEDVAEDYLTDLIHRSMVTIAQEKSKGGVKACRIHDLLRDFCLIKAKEDNFLELTHGYDELFPSSNDGMDPSSSFSSTPITYHLRRICIYSKKNHFTMLKPSGPLVRSLLFFSLGGTSPYDSYDISFIFQNFKLLRILDLEYINVGDSFEAIVVLIHLRYLALQGHIDFIPSSIVNLWNLQTFCVKALEGRVVKVPDSIWDMVMLRHMHINDNAVFGLESHRLENSSILDNLRTFSTPSLAYGDDMEKILRKLRGVQKLKCIFLDSWDDATKINQFPDLEFLSQLVSLKVFYDGMGKYPCQFSFPSNLEKLTLSNFHMPWTEISQLTLLQNLKVLKLLNNAFEGEIWEMGDQEFPQLKFLKLENLNVVKWSAEGDHFPCLERLLLHKCVKLEEIPAGVGDIPTLLLIDVMWCSSSVATSVKEIQKEQQLEYGNEVLKIHVR